MKGALGRLGVSVGAPPGGAAAPPSDEKGVYTRYK